MLILKKSSVTLVFMLLIFVVMSALNMTADGATHENAKSRFFKLDSMKHNCYMLRLMRPSGSHPESLGGWKVRHPVFRFVGADIDGDGRQEALVGVIKTTRYDPVARKRLFIYRQSGNSIRPMYLCSHLAYQLEDFNTIQIKKAVCIITIERGRTRRNFMVGLWQWDAFGLRLLRYLARNKSREEAKNLFTYYKGASS